MNKINSLIFFAALFLLSCMAKTYHDEMQSELDSVKTTTKNIDERYNNKFEILSEKIKGLSQSVKDLDKTQGQNKADLNVMVEDLKVEIQSLRGAIEENTHKVTTSETSLNKSISDLDARVQELENKFGIILANLSKIQSLLKEEDKGGDKSSKNEKPDNLNTSEITEYDSILRLITVDKNFDLASEKLKKFISKFSSSDLTDNAQYWLGECYYARGDYKTAIPEFRKVISNYPNSDKKCDALLKESYSYEKIKVSDKSRAILKEVISACPDSSYSKIALEKLSSFNPKEKSSASKKPR